VDGVVGPITVEALNAGPRDRARQLAIAMERLRWLERDPPPTRIDVNVAATVLDYYRDGQLADHRRVVAGEPGWETPQLGSPIFRLVANPNWTVPASIVEDEISKKSSSWLARNNFSQKNGQWVQAPGPDSALGEVKLDMKNDHAIYLHDTPAKALFSQTDRHRSHGCVRVDRAVEFARMLAQHSGVIDEFDKALASGDQTFIDLDEEIPVRLLYHTAFLGTDGRIKFAKDVYGWDNDVADALGYETRKPSRVEHRPGRDVGP
jgi:L,D-transpeptidase YcbB